MGKSASYVLTGSDGDECKSIDPAHPDEKGLIHFYQKQIADKTDKDGNPVKEWKFLTPSEYEAKKNELPDLCYATRHNINWLQKKAQEEFEAAKKAAQEELEAAQKAAAEEEKKNAAAEEGKEGEEAKTATESAAAETHAETPAETPAEITAETAAAADDVRSTRSVNSQLET